VQKINEKSTSKKGYQDDLSQWWDIFDTINGRMGIGGTCGYVCKKKKVSTWDNKVGKKKSVRVDSVAKKKKFYLGGLTKGNLFSPWGRIPAGLFHRARKNASLGRSGKTVFLEQEKKGIVQKTLAGGKVFPGANTRHARDSLNGGIRLFFKEWKIQGVGIRRFWGGGVG